MMCKVMIFGCIAAAILLTAAYGAPYEKTTLSAATKAGRLKDALKDLECLKKINNDFLDFYTPNNTWECNHTTLACFLKELKVLEQDVDKKYKQHVINIEKNLEDFKDGGFSNPTCKKCEANEKKKFPEFCQEMISFLQFMHRETVSSF